MEPVWMSFPLGLTVISYRIFQLLFQHCTTRPHHIKLCASSCPVNPVRAESHQNYSDLWASIDVSPHCKYLHTEYLFVTVRAVCC